MLGERRRALNQNTRECFCQPPLSDHQEHGFVYMISYPNVVSNNTPRRGVIGGSIGTTSSREIGPLEVHTS